MNHTAAVNVWKQTNRVSRLWAELAENYVAPEPLSKQGLSLNIDRTADPPVTPAPVLDAGPRSSLAAAPSSFNGPWAEIDPGERTFMERVGQGSIHLFKQALEVLTAPPDDNTAAEAEQDRDGRPAASQALEQERAEVPPAEAGYDLYPVMVKVSFEPEPDASVIETRRAVYGLKIPVRPLHKRPIYQRLFFCLRIWFRKAAGKSEVPRKLM